MELSKRLHAVASLVTEGASVADIGTDHGYVPIYLAENGICTHLIAMDINRGPIEKAREHISRYGFEEQIDTRLSDGLQNLTPGEVDTMIAAGMGGGLTIRILSNSPEIVQSLEEFILQPQSEIHKVREYLNQNGFELVDEEMVEEDGKYYPVMKLKHGEESAFSEVECYYGRKLLAKKHPVLHEYLLREYFQKQQILEKLISQNNERIADRIEEIRHEIKRTETALSLYQSQSI